MIFDDIYDSKNSIHRHQCLAGVNRMSGRGIKKKKGKHKWEKTVRYPKTGTEIIDGMGRQVDMKHVVINLLVHGDGELYGKGKFQGEGKL
jgi:hypothetical protein